MFDLNSNSMKNVFNYEIQVPYGMGLQRYGVVETINSN